MKKLPILKLLKQLESKILDSHFHYSSTTGRVILGTLVASFLWTSIVPSNVVYFGMDLGLTILNTISVVAALVATWIVFPRSNNKSFSTSSKYVHHVPTHCFARRFTRARTIKDVKHNLTIQGIVFNSEDVDQEIDEFCMEHRGWVVQLVQRDKVKIEPTIDDTVAGT